MTTLFATKFNSSFEIIKVLLSDSFKMIYEHHRNTSEFEVSDLIRVKLTERSIRHLEVLLSFKKNDMDLVYINTILKSFHPDRHQTSVSMDPETIHISLLINHETENKYNNLLLLLISLFQYHKNIPDKKYNVYTYSDVVININDTENFFDNRNRFKDTSRQYPLHDIENQYGNSG